MASISTPGIDLEANWSLFAIVGLLIAGILFIVYDVFNQSGASSAVQTASDVVQSAGSVVQAPLDAVTNAVSTASGTGSSSSTFYAGINSFFDCGSIYGCGGN